MGTNIYMRKIPKAERKKELMDLIARQYQQRIDSIKEDLGRCPGEADRSLDEDIDLLRQQIYEEVHIGKCSHGWKFLFAPNPKYYQEIKESVLAFIHSEDWTLMDEYGKPLIQIYFGKNMSLLTKTVSPQLPIKNGKFNTEKQINPRGLHLSTKQ